MHFLISPAKSLDCLSEPPTQEFSIPVFINEATILAKILQKKSAKKLRGLMDISEKLSELNVQRYARWNGDLEGEEAKQAVFMFQGDVYQGLNVSDLNANQLSYVNEHTFILSGLYGLLTPLDKILPYRLEMSTQLKNRRGRDLYAFWRKKIAKHMNQSGSEVFINLASNEYIKSVDRSQLTAPMIDIVFKDWSNGQFKVIGFFAKKARGIMLSWAAKQQVTDPQQLKQFDQGGYVYDSALSTPQKWVFTRKIAA